MKLQLHTAALVLTLSSQAFATDFVVSTGQSIQAAIDAAAAGDRILVDAGTYVELLDLHGKAIEVIGVSGAQATVLDADLMGTAVRMLDGEGPDTVLRGFTVTRGSGGLNPGGIWTNGTPTIEDCVITFNSGRQGGGVRGNAHLTGCTIANNTSSLNHGGGLYGAPVLTDCIVASNTCTGSRGGGLYITGGNAALTRCEITENGAVLAGGRGGGIYLGPNASLVAEHCTVARNLVAGGVFGSYGGGAFIASGSAMFRACTIVDNTLATGNQAGGGVYGQASLVDCIVRGNTANQLEQPGSVTYSNIADSQPGIGNINADPLFWDAPNGDYHLRSGSPCIDAGDPASPLDPDGSRADIGTLPFDPSWPLPVHFCTANPNSTGSPASMGYTGTYGVAQNDLVLTAKDCAANQFGLFFLGADESQVPLGDGILCIASPQYRMPVVSTSPGGMASYAVDLTNLLAGTPSITAGSSWGFQFWFRDQNGPLGQGSNLSDGLRIVFTP